MKKNFFHQLKDIFFIITTYFFSKTCICCNENSFYSICENCLEKIDLCDGSPFKLCHEVKIFSATLYKGAVRKMIHGLKYHKKMELATFLANILHQYWQKTTQSNTCFLVAPIPVHAKRKRKRGFDQSELVAKKFATLNNYEYVPNLLKRIRYTDPQHKLTSFQRQKNLQKAFKLYKKPKKDLPILLIDDIYTTGSTVTEAIQALTEAQITNISVLTISHVNDFKKNHQNI